MPRNTLARTARSEPSEAPGRARPAADIAAAGAAGTAGVDGGTTHSRFLAVFSGLLVAMLLSSLDQTIFSTALPTIVGELNGVEHQLWVTTAYMLTATIMMPVYGKLGDLLGRKNLFIGAISIFLVGTVVGGSAASMTALIAARAIQGLGGGGLMILSQSIIADVVPARDRGKYMGAMGAVFGLSSIIGPLLGGWFTESLSWRWAFWINVPLGLAAVAAAAIFLDLPRHRLAVAIDWRGIATMAVATSAIILICAWGGHTYAWDSAQVLGLAALAVVGAIAFVAVERRAEAPIIPLHLFASRNFNLATIAGMIIAIGMFGAISYMPTYFQMVYGYSATEAGLLLISMVSGLMGTALLTGNLASRTGRYKWMTIACVVVAAIGLGLLSTIEVTTSVQVLCAYLFVLGAGIGLGMQIFILIVQNSFPDREVGAATAANNFFREIGATLGAAIVGSIFTSNLTSLLTERMSEAGIDPARSGAAISGLTPAVVNALPEQLRTIVTSAYSEALTPVFGHLVPLVLVALVIVCFIREVPLRTSVEEH